MYGPPPCRKRKVILTGWSAQMYSAFRRNNLSQAMMECAALSSSLVGQPSKTVSHSRFQERRVRPLCHLIIRQQTWQENLIFVVVAGL